MIQAILNGIFLGGILASLAVGFSILWRVMGVVNVAHAAFCLLSAYLIFFLVSSYGIDPLICLLIVLPLFFGIGVGLYWILIRRLPAKDITSASPVLGVGMMIIIQNLIHGRWSASEITLRGVPYLRATVNWEGLIFSGAHCIGFALSLMALAMVYVLLHRTMLGKAIRAIWQDKEGALLYGINFDHVSAITSGLSLALGAVGGLCLAFIYSFYPTIYFDWLFFMFLIPIIGGVGSLKGVFAGGIIVGLVMSLTPFVVPFEWLTVVIFAALIAVLLWRPAGLFRT